MGEVEGSCLISPGTNKIVNHQDFRLYNQGAGALSPSLGFFHSRLSSIGVGRGGRQRGEWQSEEGESKVPRVLIGSWERI